MVIKAVVFDMDDTLFLEKDYVISGYRSVDSWIKNHLHQNGFYETAINLFNKGETKFVFDKSLALLGIDFDEYLIKTLVKVYRTHKPDIKLTPDASWVLDQLGKGIKIGLISDGYYESQKIKVKTLNLDKRFHSIILTDQIGKEYWKPNILPYQLITENLAVAHNECVYIGDNVNKDFVTAKKLGWLTVQIERQDSTYYKHSVLSEYKAEYKITNLKQLAKLPELKELFISNDEQVAVK